VRDHASAAPSNRAVFRLDDPGFMTKILYMGSPRNMLYVIIISVLANNVNMNLFLMGFYAHDKREIKKQVVKKDDVEDDI
jgi:hypothetical protein